MFKNKLIIILLVLGLSIPVFGNKIPFDISVDGRILNVLDEELISYRLDVRVIDGRTMIPIRVVSENLSAEVKWNTKTSEYEVYGTNVKTNNPTIIKGMANSPQVTVDGNPSRLDESDNVVAKVIDGKTYVPLRFFAEALGYKIESDTGYAGIRMIYLDSPDAPSRPPMRTGEGVKYKEGMGEREFNAILKERIEGMTVYENEYGSQAQFKYHHKYLDGSEAWATCILFGETNPYEPDDKGFTFKMIVPWGWNDPGKNQGPIVLGENAATMRAVREIFSALTVEGDRVFAELDFAIIDGGNHDGYTVKTSDGRTFKFTGESSGVVVRIN